jgi:polyhydroxybutyrate depolymerase
VRFKQSFYSLIAVLLLLPTFGSIGGAISAQSSTISCSGKSAVTAGTDRQSIESGGETRSYIVYVPASYDPTQPLPLVISLHGFASNALEQSRYAQWDTIADSDPLIAVYPNGTGSPQRWNSGQTEIAGVREQARGPLAQFLSGFFETVPADDVAFMRDLIAHVSDEYCIDASRIFVNGISNGGGMTNRLACELSDEIAAVGMVSGAYTDFPGGCHPTRPVPVMAFHGKADPIVPYNGNEDIHFPVIEQWVADWAERDQCDAAAKIVLQVTETIVSTRYPICADGAEVVFFSISDGGHTWPGSRPTLQFILGKTTQEIDASETMWAFFKAHPMP